MSEGQINAVAKHIYQEGGAVQKYNSATGKWQSVIPEGNDWIFNNAVPSPQYGKPLVLLANWMDGIEPKQLYNSGFAEAAADTLFASMVQLDLNNGGGVGGSLGQLYDSTGKLIRTQGAVFNSPLHFVGFGQGAVVNSEIVQLLGTFFPNAGGTALENRDLQMTTIDPYNYGANSFKGHYLNILDPEIKVWNNVTYADNYYQTNGSGNTINGRELSGTNGKADWNVSLNNLAGFVPDDGAGASHREALAWYAGTANLTGSKLPSENGDTIYRRLGDLEQNNIADATKTWYTPDHTNASFTHGNEKAPWEGIGTGWFHSVLGGGAEVRPYFDGEKKNKNQLGNFEDYLKNNLVSVYEDNTYRDSTKPFGTRMRGDYAVPTLFNGNFDAVAGRLSAQTIPGWSLFNCPSENTSQSYLVDWLTIGLQEASTAGKGLIGSGYLDAIGYNEDQPNYALRMGAGGAKQITHNYFVMPEWGDLRFNLHAPYKNGGKLKVSLETKPETDSKGRLIANSGTHLLKEIDLAADPGNTLETYAADIDKIGFGRGGFETFHVDSNQLDKFRGQVAKLRFEVEGNTRVYLDDVFFKSAHLKFGNPSEARYSSDAPGLNNPYTNNLLIEKPQYAVSYDNRTKNPVWVSWQVNKSWLGNTKRPDATIFAGDPALPKGWPKIDTSYYQNPAGYSWGFDQGHTIPSRDRTRDPKDNLATFLGTNLIPQLPDNNQWFYSPTDPAGASAWYNVEQFVTNLVQSGKEAYVVAGSHGTNQQPQKRSNAREDKFPGETNSAELVKNGINIPTWTWKSILVLDRPGQGSPNVTKDTRVHTFLTPNRAEPSAQDWANAGEQGIMHPFYEIGEKLNLERVLTPIKNVTEWRDPNTWMVSIKELENLLQGKNINLLSNVPESVREELKKRIYSLL